MAFLYEKLMAEKGAPRAANAPNQAQLRGAPMNLRSAMQKYAVGGGVGSPPPSASDINSFVQANIGNPQAIADAAQQYGVSMDDLANATGYSSSQINDYFGNAGISPFGTSPSPSVMGSGTLNVPPRPYIPDESMFVPPSSSIPPTIMPNEGLNEPEVNYGSFEPAYRGRLNDPLITQNPPETYDPRGASPANLDPVKRFNFNNPEVSSELLRKIQESMANPFGSQITNQDELMKLLQALKVK